jgi:hypothetical protein
MIPKTVTDAADVIHVAICEDSIEDCREEYGQCQKAATELYHAGLLAETRS